MITIHPKEIPQAKLHQYLLGAIAPRPIAFASTIDAEGRMNLAPYSFFNVFSSNPPIVIFSPARRGRDNTTKHTLENVHDVRECVINIVSHSIVEQMSLASTEYPREVSEFVKSGLTPIPSDLVRPFRVKEAPVQLECKVNDIVALGNQGGAGNLVIAEVLCMHLHQEILDDEGKIDPVKIDLVARMGGHWYTRASAGLFQIAQPTTQIAIGFDKLPADILKSPVLTGNQLAQLAGVTALPDETDVNEFKLTELADLFIEFDKNYDALEKALHEKAAVLIDKKNINDAWKTLLSLNRR